MRTCVCVSVCVHACVHSCGRSRARVCVYIYRYRLFIVCVYTYIDIDYLLCISKLYSLTRGHTSMREERTDRATSFTCMRILIYNRLLFERTVMSEFFVLILDSSLFHTPMSILLS